MPNLSEEERKILQQARKIQDRLEAERLEAGEIDLESEGKRKKRQEELKQEELRKRQMEIRRRQQEAHRQAAARQAAQEGDGSASQRTSRSGKEENSDYWKAAKREVAGSEEAVRMGRPRAAAPRSGRTASAADAAARERRAPRTVSSPQTRRREEQIPRKRKKKSAAGKAIKIIMTIVILLAVLFGGAYFIVRAIVSRTNFQPYETSYERAGDVMSDPDVTNILLIGSDERESVDTARSDAMIVLSINETLHEITMTSILRDSYVTIPGYGQQRINHAYQMGGEALLIQTIEENFKLGIDYYASVDFFSFMDIIDCVGGVEIAVQPEEVEWINAYVAELNNILGSPEGDQYISSAGTMTLSGKQALAYSRIRYVGTDFARTERQRTVLNALIGKLKSANPVQLFRVVNTVLPDVNTDINDHAMTMMLFKAVFYLGYDVQEFRVPMDGTWWNEDANGQEVLGIDFAANIAGLKSTIYGE